ncbi:hypothetical protein WMW71_07775 [Flavobacterium buctense]|uniref:HTTM domain-containing protein n=1 Tax=Flavobacterium buctense TaxID=1648146 RepID=A0ABU9E0P5_9FLAO|nr:hypothetical protein [Flavobacterium buctense]
MKLKNSILKFINQLKTYNWKTILVGVLLISIVLHFLYMFDLIQNRIIRRWIIKVSLSLFFISTLVLIIILTRKKISRWLSVTVNPELMVITRKLYAVLCLFSAVQHFSLIQHGLEPYNLLLLGREIPSAESYSLSAAYIVALIMLFIGYKIRLAWILVFLFGGLIIPFSLEIFLKNIFNFYAIFISVDLWKGKKTNEGSWAIVLMCLSACVLMSAAGLHKLLGPVWQEGLGFYYSLNIAYFPDRYLWDLLDYKGLMYFFNWATIIVEIIALPLFLFKRTWPLVIWCFLGLALFLSFAMSGIGIMGGPIVFCMILLFLSLTQIPVKISRFLSKKNHQAEERLSPNVTPSFLSSNGVALLVFWYTILLTFNVFFRDYRLNKFDNPPVFSYFENSKLSKNKPLNPIAYKLNFIDQTFITPIKPHKYWQFTWSIPLFNYHHLFDRLYFKVIFTDYANKEVEIINYFDQDGAISEVHPLVGNERFLLSCFRMMDAVRSEPFLSSSQLNLPMEKELQGIINYSLNHQKASQYKSATIYIKPMRQPFSYKGNCKPWIEDPWIAFYHFNLKDKKGKVVNKPSIFEYDKLEIDAFKQKIIVPKF